MSHFIASASQLLPLTTSTALAELSSRFQEAPLTHVASGVVAVLVFSYLFQRIRARSRLAGVPEPSGHSLLWGHQRIVVQKTVGKAWSMWMDEVHAQVYKTRGALFSRDVLVVGDPLAATHIMQKHVYDYPHTQLVRSRVARMLGKSLGWVEGESEHKRMRALVGPSLGPEALRAGTADVYLAAENFADQLRNHILGHNGPCEISIVDWVNNATLEAIGRLGFGYDFEAGRGEDAMKILGAWRSMARFSITMSGFYGLTVLRRFPLLAHLPLKTLRVQGEVRNTIHKGVAKELLRRNQGAAQEGKGNDLLSRLTSAHTSGAISTEELMDHISMFIIAGSETTAQSLAFATMELARNPDVQARLREEAMSFPGSPSYDDLQTQLPYLDAVMREVLRMHPSAPSMERVAVKDDVLPLRHPITGSDGKVLTSIPISAGQTVVIPIHTMNRLDSIWTDGSNFRPERWMGELPNKDITPTGWSRILTFSDGPRNCIGFRFAILQFKIILFTLIQRFKFEDAGAEIVYKAASSMQPTVAGEEEKGPRLPIKVSFV